MWLGLALFIVIAVALIASIASGGIFLIVMIPIAVIAAVSAIAYFGIARLGGMRKMSPDATGLPHGSPSPSPRPATPDELVDARQRA